MEHRDEHAQTQKRPQNEGIRKTYFYRTDYSEKCCLVRGVGGAVFTSDVIFVGGVDFFYSSVAEGQFSHPVHASPHACGQTKVGTGRSCVETVSGKVVRTEAKTKKEDVSTGSTGIYATKWHNLSRSN